MHDESWSSIEIICDPDFGPVKGNTSKIRL